MPDHYYNQNVRLLIEQSYDFDWVQQDDPDHHFSPVYGELEVKLDRYLSVRGDAEWSPYGDGFPSRNIMLWLSDWRQDSLFVEYRFQDEDSDSKRTESIKTSAKVKVAPWLSVAGYYERNLDDHRDIQTSVGFLYHAQCWSLNFRYIDDTDDRRYEFMITLMGLGGFSQSVSGENMESPFAKP